MSQITQEKIEPEGLEPEPPKTLKKHLFDNPDILTNSEKNLPPGAGTAVIGFEEQVDDLASEVLRLGLD